MRLALLFLGLAGCVQHDADARVRPPEREPLVERDTADSAGDDTDTDTDTASGGDTATEAVREVYVLECDVPEGFDPAVDTLPQIRHAQPIAVRPGEDFPRIAIWQHVSDERQAYEDEALTTTEYEPDWVYTSEVALNADNAILIECQPTFWVETHPIHGYPYDRFIIGVEY